MDSDSGSEESKRDDEHIKDVPDAEDVARRKKRRRAQGESDEDAVPKGTDKEVMQL